jgi:hypothetical protein
VSGREVATRLSGGRIAGGSLAAALVLATPVAGVAQVSTRVWALNVGFYQSWYSDALPGSVTTPTQSFVERLGLGLTYTRQSPRTQVEFGAEGTGVYYTGVEGSDRVNYSGSLAVTRRASPRLSLRLSEAIVSTYSQGAPLLAVQGLVYPLAYHRTNQLSGGASYQLTSRTSASAHVRHDLVDFGSIGLIGGWQLITGGGLTRSLTAVDSLGISYDYRLSRYENDVANNSGTHTVELGWTRQLDTGLSLALNGGVSRLDVVGFDSRFAATGDATLSATFKTSALSLRYERGFGQAFGLARERIADTVGLVYSRTLSRSVDSTLSGIYGSSRDPLDPSFSYTSQRYDLGLRYRVGRRWSLGAAYGVTLVEASNVNKRVSQNAAASLAYGWEWR